MRRSSESCRAALEELWRSWEAAPALLGTPRVRIEESVEDERYDPGPAG